jgi:hypothetical protein
MPVFHLSQERQAAGLPLGREAAYFIGGGGFMGQDRDDSVLDYNVPPKDQPGLWCQWPTEDRTAIAWNGGEKFYCYVPWLRYLLEHFPAPPEPPVVPVSEGAGRSRA